MRTLPPLVRKAVALGLALCVVLGLAIFVVMPAVASLDAMRQRIEMEREVQGRLRDAIADWRPVDDKAEPANNAALYLEGESDGVTGANLQVLLTGYASAAGVKLRSTRSLPQRDRFGLHLIGVQMQLSGPIEAVQQLIFRIENSSPTLVIDSLALSGYAQRFGVATDGTALEVRMDIYGAMLRVKS